MVLLSGGAKCFGTIPVEAFFLSYEGHLEIFGYHDPIQYISYYSKWERSINVFITTHKLESIFLQKMGSEVTKVFPLVFS